MGYDKKIKIFKQFFYYIIYDIDFAKINNNYLIS